LPTDSCSHVSAGNARRGLLLAAVRVWAAAATGMPAVAARETRRGARPRPPQTARLDDDDEDDDGICCHPRPGWLSARFVRARQLASGPATTASRRATRQADRQAGWQAGWQAIKQASTLRRVCVMAKRAAPWRERAGCGQRLERVKPPPRSAPKPSSMPLPCCQYQCSPCLSRADHLQRLQFRYRPHDKTGARHCAR